MSVIGRAVVSNRICRSFLSTIISALFLLTTASVASAAITVTEAKIASGKLVVKGKSTTGNIAGAVVNWLLGGGVERFRGRRGFRSDPRRSPLRNTGIAAMANGRRY